MAHDAEKQSVIAKVLIIIALVVAVGAVIVAKHSSRMHGEETLGDSRSTSEQVAPAGGERTTEPASSSKSSDRAIPKLVDLGAGKCIPCKMMAPILEELKQEYAGRLVVEFIDVWENPDAGKKYGIQLIPTQIFYDSVGRERFPDP